MLVGISHGGEPAALMSGANIRKDPFAHCIFPMHIL